MGSAQSKNPEGIEELLDIVEGAPRMDIFLEEIPYPKNYLKPEIEISDYKLIKLKEYGIIGESRASVFITDEPKFPGFFTAPRDTEVREDQCGSSLDLSIEKAKIRSMAECVERYCLRNLHKRIFGNYKELSKNYNLLNSDSIGIDEKIKFSWAEVFDVRKRDAVYIPSQLIYVPNNFSDHFSNEPIIMVPTSNGAAYGNSYEMAIYNGLLEIIERDATLISWLAKRELPRIKLDTEKTKKLEEYFNQYNLELNIFETTTDLDVPVMMAMIRDKTKIGPAISVGAGSSLDPEKAVIKSILEAQQGRIWIRFSYIVEGKPEIKPSEIVDMKTRSYYWYNEDKIPELDFLLKNEEIKGLSSINNQENNFQENIGKISNKLLEKEYDLFIADISTIDVKKVGSRVVKVICPELQPFYLNENYPVYSKRLENYLQGPINKVPHPVI